MKNILAENLLRFGVKNLSEADKLRLEQATTTAGGGGAVAGKKPAVTKKPQPFSVQFVMNSLNNLNSTKTCTVKASLDYNSETGAYTKPSSIDINFLDNTGTATATVQLMPNSNGYYEYNASTHEDEKLKDYIRNNVGLAYGPVTPGMAIKQLSDAINQQLKAQPVKAGYSPQMVKLGTSYQAIVDVFKEPQKIGKRIVVTEKLTGNAASVFKGVTGTANQAKLTVYKDPATDKEVYRKFNIGTLEFNIRSGRPDAWEVEAYRTNLIKANPSLQQYVGNDLKKHLQDIATPIYDNLSQRV